MSGARARATNVSDVCGNFLTHSKYENKRKQFKSETETITSIVVSSSGTFFLIAYLFIILVNVIALIPSRWQQCDDNTTHYYYTRCVCRRTKIAFDYILRSLRLYKASFKVKVRECGCRLLFERMKRVVCPTSNELHLHFLNRRFIQLNSSASPVVTLTHTRMHR